MPNYAGDIHATGGCLSHVSTVFIPIEVDGLTISSGINIYIKEENSRRTPSLSFISLGWARSLIF